MLFIIRAQFLSILKGNIYFNVIVGGNLLFPSVLYMIIHHAKKVHELQSCIQKEVVCIQKENEK